MPELTDEQRGLFTSSQMLLDLTRNPEAVKGGMGDDTSFEINLNSSYPGDTPIPARDSDFPPSGTETPVSRVFPGLSSAAFQLPKLATEQQATATESTPSAVSPTTDSRTEVSAATVLENRCGACGTLASAPLQFAGLAIPCENCGAAVKFPERSRNASSSTNESSASLASSVRMRREVDLLRSIDGALRQLPSVPPLVPLMYRQPLTSSVIRRHVATLGKGVKAGEDGLSDAARAALEALSNHQASEAAAELFAQFDDAKGELKLRLLCCLADLRYEPAFPFLLRCLGVVRGPQISSVIEAVIKFGDPRGILPLIIAADLQRQLQRSIFDGIVQMGPTAAAQLCRLASESQDPMVLSTVATLLGRFEGSCPIKTFRLLLKSPDVEVRRAAARSVSLVADGASVPQLVRSLRDPDEEVRASLAQAFPRCANEEAVAGLMKFVDDPAVRVRRSVIRALGGCGLTIPLAVIRPHLEDPDMECRIASAEALGRLGDPHGLTRLLELLRSQPADGREGFTRQIAASLGRMKDSRGTLPLLNLLMTDDIPLKVQVATSLGEMGQKAAREPLERLLAQESAEAVRIAAAKSLGELGDPEARPALALALRGTVGVQIAAIRSLVALKGRKAETIETLLPMLADPKPLVRQETLLALATQQEASLIEEVLPLLADSESAVQRVALKTLRDLGDTRDDEALKTLATKRAGKKGVVAKPGQPATTRTGRSLALPKLSLPNWLTSVSPAVLIGTLANPIVLGGFSLVLALCLGVFFWMNPLQGSIRKTVPRASVGQLAVSEDGKWIAAARTRGMLEIWDVEKQRVVSQSGDLPAGMLCFGPGAKNLLCASGSRIALVSLNSGKLGDVVTLEGHKGSVVDLQCTPDHKHAVTLGGDGSLVLWDLEAGQAKGAIQSEAKLTKVAVSGDGHEVAGATGTGDLYLWNMDTKEEVSHINVRGRRFWTLAIQADGPLVAGGCEDGAVVLWDPAKPASVQIDETSQIGVRAMSFPPGGRLYVARGTQIQLKDVVAGTETFVETTLETISTLAVDRSGKLVTVGNEEESPVLVFESDSQKLVHELDET